MKGEGFKSGQSLGEFQPKALKLFHMVLLAHVVHVEYPLYALFSRQCYWFACIVFYAAQIIDKQLTQDALEVFNNNHDTTDTDLFFLPYHLFVPEGAGRWNGIKISGCKQVILNTIVRKFHKQLCVYMAKVDFLLNSESLLNS
jgi:hypothetical protein